MRIYKDEFISTLNKKLYRNLSERKFLKDKKLSVVTVKNGIVQPPISLKDGNNKKNNPSGALFGSGGVIDSKGIYVELSAQLAKNMKTRIYGSRDFDIENIKIVHEKVMYMNFFIEQWGHFLLDVIGRLWYASEHKDIKIVYTCYRGQGHEISGNFKEFLNLFGISDNRLIMVDSETQFDEVIVPESSILPGEYYTKEYKEIFEKIVNNVNPGKIIPGKRVFCSRKKIGKRNKKEFGEEIIENNLEANNFALVFMEKMSLRKQIDLLNTSETIGMTCGSLSHNLLFVRNKNKTIIFNKTYRSNLHQFMVNEISKSEATFVDVYVSPLPILYGYGPFIIRATREFIVFMNDYGYNIIDCTKSVSWMLRIKYYFRYLLSYRKFLFKLVPIKESNVEEFEPSFRRVRKQYREYLKGIQK